MKPSQAIQRLRQVIRRQHKSLSTEDAYVLWLRRYIRALQDIHERQEGSLRIENRGLVIGHWRRAGQPRLGLALAVETDFPRIRHSWSHSSTTIDELANSRGEAPEPVRKFLWRHAQGILH